MQAILDWIVANPLIVIIVIIALFLIFTYNNLNARKKRVEKSFSTIDVYLEQRFDEISSLLEQTLTAYDFEEKTHTQIAALRSGIETAKTGSINEKVSAINEIGALMASPAIKTENYPELKAIENLGMFTAQRTAKVEDDLSAARRQYNDNATSFNTAITSFPNVLVAGLFGFRKQFELFKVTEGKKERPSVKDVKKNLES